MNLRKRKNQKAREAARKARRQARLAVGAVPPSRVIEPKRKRKPKHGKTVGEQDEE